MPKRILIANDHAAIRKSILFLKPRPALKCGARLWTDSTPSKRRATEADLTILDLAMPRKNGLEAAHVLRRMLSDRPIILFTSYDAETKYVDATAVGIRAVVSKSEGLNTLVQQVERSARTRLRGFMGTEYLDQLARQLKVNKNPACRRAINRILAEIKKRCGRGEYTSLTEAELAFRKFVEDDRACQKAEHL